MSFKPSRSGRLGKPVTKTDVCIMCEPRVVLAVFLLNGSINPGHGNQKITRCMKYSIHTTISWSNSSGFVASSCLMLQSSELGSHICLREQTRKHILNTTSFCKLIDKYVAYIVGQWIWVSATIVVSCIWIYLRNYNTISNTI